jgi:hypothetical protein
MDFLFDRMRQGSIVGSVGPLHGPGWQLSHASAGQPCLNVYICERHNCASCLWMDVPLRASWAMFKEVVLISAQSVGLGLDIDKDHTLL